MGSSPLARGLRRAGDRLELHLGIIPARAGFTSPTPSVSSRSRDHPRSRGVYAHACMGIHSMIGSSPLARGLPGMDGSGADGGGIIPARAGFTTWIRLWRRPGADHPRSRGVYHPARPRHLRRPRIIPARAGFTLRAPASHARSSDHPRSRGVYRGAVAATVGNAGIIPARAGFTSYASPLLCAPQDHPRSRGVYCTTTWPTGSRRGSSPLARGLRSGRRNGPSSGRIIPARAGFTQTTQLG